MKATPLFPMALYCVVLGSAVAQGSVDPADPKVPMPKGALSYQTMRPYLKQNCFKCHSGPQPKAEFAMDTYSGLMRGGEDGVMVKKGNGEGSDLVKFLRGALKPQMPKRADPLPEADIKAISNWIQQGAREKAL